MTRQVEVAPERLNGWIERYAASHPGTEASIVDGSIVLSAAGSEATATLTPLLPLTDATPVGAALAEVARSVASQALQIARDRPVALVLIRRGGFAVGVAQDERVLASKVGTRYVQSRTAAGGWSQQRFARRRDGQARELLDAAAAAWTGLVIPAGRRPDLLVTGGDRALVDRLLEDRRLPQLTPARHLDLPDPRAAVLVEAARRAHAIQVTVREPATT